MSNNKTVPVFYAVDDNYIPFLHVSILSLIDHVSEDNQYNIYILHSGVSEEHKKIINALCQNNVKIIFVDVAEKLNRVSHLLKLRDYYTLTTYYRIFIAEMFPEYDKAVYLDCDTAVLTDIANLFDTNIENYLVAAIPDGAVSVVEPFCVYTEKALGVQPNRYFNAGILVINLKKFREIDFYGKFNDLLSKYKFIVAQDQDYLNVLCKNQVHYLTWEWNVMPIRSKSVERVKDPKIIHYNLTSKPWHYKNLMYEEFFWHYAKKSCYYDFMIKEREGFSEEDMKKDDACEKGLVALTIQEAENPNNYYNTYCK